MGIRSTLKYWIKKRLRGFLKESSVGGGKVIPNRPAVIHDQVDVDSEEDEALPLLCEKYLVCEEGEIDYLDKTGSFTRRKIRTGEVYEYDDDVLVIRAYCYKRKDYRTFVSKRIQYWKDTSTGNIVTNLAEHLRRKSQGDPGNVAEEIYKSLLVEISVAVGSLVKYSENRGMNRFRVATTKQSALLNYVLNKSDVVTALNVLSTSDREEAKDSLITMISDTIVSDTAFEASKRTFKKAKDKSKTELISFIATTMEGEPAGDTAVQILKDDLINPSFRIATGYEKGPEPLPVQEVPSEEEVTRIKEEASEAKKDYKSKKKERKRSKSYRSYERKEPVKHLALEQTIKVLAEKSNDAVEVFDREEFELDIVTAVSNALTQEELAEEGEMFLKRCGQGISLGMLIFGLKKKNKGWYPGLNGKEVIDLRNASIH